jgi:hypothetical protein
MSASTNSRIGTELAGDRIEALIGRAVRVRDRDRPLAGARLDFEPAGAENALSPVTGWGNRQERGKEPDMRQRASIGAVLLVVVGVVFGATVFRSDIAQATGLAQSVTVNNTAANPVPVREQNLDGGNIKVHEEGTALTRDIDYAGLKSVRLRKSVTGARWFELAALQRGSIGLSECSEMSLEQRAPRSGEGIVSYWA